MELLILWIRIRTVQAHLDGIDMWVELAATPASRSKWEARRMDVSRTLHRLIGAYKEAYWRTA